MRLLLLGTLSATLLGLLVYGGTLIATRRPGDSLHPVDAPDEPDEAPVVQRPVPAARALPSLAADTCTPRAGWACWRGRLQLPAGVRATWIAGRAARTTSDDAEDEAPAEPRSGPPEALPPRSPFDQFFSLDVSLFDDGAAGDSVVDEAAVSLHPDGTFEIQAPPGRYNLEATSEDNLLIGGHDDLRAVAGATEDGVDVVLAAAVSLSGRVLDEDDLPIAATLSLMRAGESSSTLTEEEDGKIAFNGLRPGTYRLVGETPDGHVTEGTYVAPRDDVTLRLPHPRAGLLLFPPQADGRCTPRHYLLRPHIDTSRGVVPPATIVGGNRDEAAPIGARNARARLCQAVVENVLPESTWDVMSKDLSGPVMTQVHFGSDRPLAPVCVQGPCTDHNAVLEPWLLDLNGDRVDFPLMVIDPTDNEGTGLVSASPGDDIYYLRANQTVTVRVDTEVGLVTQQVWLRPGVNRTVIRLPIRRDSSSEVSETITVN